ncbi:hypothetical protein RJ640_005147 [Escallonia rubra]|uniref:BZIP domain-containing protein n=1 Tax=Escallonia rubra TaxID=112253 RepID=A0AA88RP09_9ASTE|nr:hypothetical protein RJ640_005147 [Escallonia rubra]
MAVKGWRNGQLVCGGQWLGQAAVEGVTCSFPSTCCVSSSYPDSFIVGLTDTLKPMEGQGLHQRCSSESVPIEDQPSWLDELLSEPETVVHRGHRHSASDSSAYLDAAVEAFDIREGCKLTNPTAEPSWKSHNFFYYKDSSLVLVDKKPSSIDGRRYGVWESSSNSVTGPRGLPPTMDGIAPQISGSASGPHTDQVLSPTTEKYDMVELGSQNSEGSGGRSDCSQAKPSVPKADAKRAKQKSAQRSRVRKLQYIAELERSIQALQAEGSVFTAELEFLDQQNLILGMENRALRQRLDSLAQEQLIKQLEQEMLEREIGRLQTLHQLQRQQQMQQQQQQQQQPQQSNHVQGKSRDLETQFANLSIQNNGAASSSGSLSGPVRI